MLVGDIEERSNIVIKSFLERQEEQNDNNLQRIIAVQEQQKEIIEKKIQEIKTLQEINERQTYTISSLLSIQEQQLRKNSLFLDIQEEQRIDIKTLLEIQEEQRLEIKTLMDIQEEQRIEIRTLLYIQEEQKESIKNDIKSFVDSQKEELQIQENIFNRRLETISSVCLDVVLRDGKFYRNVNSTIYPQYFTGGYRPSIIMLPFSDIIDLDQYHLIKTLFCQGTDFIINIELIKLLPNLKILYLEQPTTNIFNNIDLQIESLYIICDHNWYYSHPQNYSPLVNLKFLYIEQYASDLEFPCINTIETLYLNSITRIDNLNLTHLTSLKKLFIGTEENPCISKINLSNLYNLEYLSLKCPIEIVDFNGLVNLRILDISKAHTVGENPSLLSRLQYLVMLKIRSNYISYLRVQLLPGFQLKYLIIDEEGSSESGIISKEEMINRGIIRY